MDFALWEFADQAHPVYDRPPDESRWAFTLPGVEAAEYEPAEREGFEREPLHMSLDAVPPADWYQLDASGNTVLTIRLHSRYTVGMDLTAMRRLAHEMYEMFRALSRGPLTYKQLADLGHPYGYGVPGEPLTWEKLTRPRKVSWRTPAGRSFRHIRGYRGSVPTMSVVHRHTGAFEAAWRYSMMVTPDGLVLSFWNERKSERGAPIPWFLAHGTIKMQAHGPWEAVPRRFWGELVREWRAEALRNSLRQRAMQGQFGEAATEA